MAKEISMLVCLSPGDGVSLLAATIALPSVHNLVVYRGKKELGYCYEHAARVRLACSKIPNFALTGIYKPKQKNSKRTAEDSNSGNNLNINVNADPPAKRSNTNGTPATKPSSAADAAAVNSDAKNNSTTKNKLNSNTSKAKNNSSANTNSQNNTVHPLLLTPAPLTPIFSQASGQPGSASGKPTKLQDLLG